MIVDNAQAVQQLGLEGGVLVLEALPGAPAAKASIQSTYRQAVWCGACGASVAPPWFHLSCSACCVCRDDQGRVVLGDIIIGFNGQPVKLQKDLFEKLDDCEVRMHFL